MKSLLIIKKLLSRVVLKCYKLTLPIKKRRLRNKLKNNKGVDVLFVLNDLAKWKSEKLYLKMIEHPSFNPVLGVTYRPGGSKDEITLQRNTLIEYLNRKGYEYITLTNTYYPTPDIIIYSEPYRSSVPKSQSVYKYFNSLFVSINYSSHTTHLDIDYFSTVHLWAWIDCYESKDAIIDAYKYIGKKRKSICLTGLPMIDQLLDKPTKDPWKRQSKPKKRIIWAPHHSLGGFEGESIIYGTFLEYAEYMLQIAKIYEDKIQFAFKPHPLLKDKLVHLWGKEAADKYYETWKNLSNGQLEIGEYHDLFATSDALIHDCSSFIVEYHLSNKPSLFLINNIDNILEDLNQFGRKAFFTQNLSHSKEDIKLFINAILNGDDPNEVKRKEFLKNSIEGYPEGNASDKILEMILTRI